jgi:hypothetical protein
VLESHLRYGNRVVTVSPPLQTSDEGDHGIDEGVRGELSDPEAEPDTIWSILTDARRYSEWDSGVVRVEGTIAPGEKIRVTSAVNARRAFPVKVTQFSPGQIMEWTGGMPMGLFKGVRTFRLTPQGDGVTRFSMREEYTGPLLPLVWRSMPDLGPSFQQFATGLKNRAERTT